MAISGIHAGRIRFLRSIPPPAGDVPVQIQRTVRRERYRDGTPAPGTERFEFAGGEFAVIDQYRRAIEAAERTIYIEDQAIGSPEIVDRLHGALERGVDVVFLVPVDPPRDMLGARRQGGPKFDPFFESLAALGRHEHFCSQASWRIVPKAVHQAIYVHAKIALVDDAWATIGSTNVANRSFYGDTEMNASIWHGPTVRALRAEFLREHLCCDTRSTSG